MTIESRFIMTTTLKFCEQCDRYWGVESYPFCCVCGSSLVTREVSSMPAGTEVKIVVCKGCHHPFNRNPSPECPECGKQYISSALELLPSQSEAQKKAVRHAEAFVERLRSQEQTFAEVHLTSVKAYRPLRWWERGLRAILRRVKL